MEIVLNVILGIMVVLNLILFYLSVYINEQNNEIIDESFALNKKLLDQNLRLLEYMTELEIENLELEAKLKDLEG